MSHRSQPVLLWDKHGSGQGREVLLPMASTVQAGNHHQPTTLPEGVNSTGTEKHIHLLEDQIKDLQDEVVFSSIKIRVMTFTSRTQT